MSWFRRPAAPRPAAAAPFGPLEWRILEALWERGTAATVRDLLPGFPDAAYTTVMTTLDRLHRKQVLDRTKAGRAFVYSPRHTRSELDSHALGDAIRAALSQRDALVEPLLSCFVDAVGAHDQTLLDELERLVRARRTEREERS